MLTQVLGLEFAELGITVNAVCPGYVNTQIMQEVFQKRGPIEGMTPEEYEKKLTARIPFGRMCEPSEVAELMTFLASDRADYITGVNLHFVAADIVEISVFHDGIGRFGVDIAGGAEIAAEDDRTDAEDSAAAAEVEGALALPGVLFKRGKAHARCCMRAGSEQQAGVEAQRNLALLGAFDPLRHNKKLLADLERLIVLLPVVFPVGIAHGRGFHLKLRLHGVEQPSTVLVVLNIEFNARNALIAFLQRGIDIVPILAVIFKEGLKIVLVFNYKSVNAEGGQPVAGLVGVFAFYSYFGVIHLCSILKIATAPHFLVPLGSTILKSD